MGKKFFKCKNLFLVTFLAVAGFFSAAAFMIRTPSFNEAKAADTNYYMIGSGSFVSGGDISDLRFASEAGVADRLVRSIFRLIRIDAI